MFPDFPLSDEDRGKPYLEMSGRRGLGIRADDLLDELQNKQDFGYIAVSLGYFDTLMSCSGSSTSSELSEEDQKEAGISPGLVRISIGFTGTLEQRWGQLETALRRTGLLEN